MPACSSNSGYPSVPDRGLEADSVVAECPEDSARKYPALVGVANEDQPGVLSSVANQLQQAVLQHECSQAPVRVQQGAAARPTPFHGERPPPISLEAYVERIAKFGKCSPVCFVMAYVYIERLSQADTDFRPTSLSVHRLLITGILLAVKLTDDLYFNNAYYARIGGLSTAELNSLELVMLSKLQYRLHVSPAEIQHQLRLLQPISSGGGSVVADQCSVRDTLRPALHYVQNAAGHEGAASHDHRRATAVA